VASRYQLATLTGAGNERARPYAADDELRPGDVVYLDGRHWLVTEVDPADDTWPVRAVARPARYRLLLRYPDGHDELGAFRRYRPDAPDLGHTFTTLEDGLPVGWQVVDKRLAYDAEGQPFLELRAERDYSEVEELPDHELEHAIASRGWDLPEAAAATFSRAEESGLAVELVALEEGEEPDWEGARRYIDALILDEIEDDLLELCGVNPGADPRETWLETVKQRLREDLELFRGDVEGDHDEIEEWDFRGGRVLVSVGSFDDEANPASGHGWMSRLTDSGALTAAGFSRVRKAELA
jgi:hypothetical protein